MEIWKSIKGHENYMVSSSGRFAKIIKPTYTKKGYLKINVDNKSCRAHRLVAEAFIPNPNNYPQVNHIDKKRDNNDISNLEWCTNRYNSEYSLAKPVAQIDIETGEIIATYKSLTIASNQTGLAPSSISNACRGIIESIGGFSWRYL